MNYIFIIDNGCKSQVTNLNLKLFMEQQLTEQEIQKINELQSRYSELTTEFGQIAIEKLIVKKQLTNLETIEADIQKKYESVHAAEVEFSKQLNEKYGIGSINLETNTFTSINS